MTVSAQCLKIVGIVVFVIAVDVVNVQLALMNGHETALTATIFEMRPVRTLENSSSLLHTRPAFFVEVLTLVMRLSFLFRGELTASA